MGLYGMRKCKDTLLFRIAVLAHNSGLTPNRMTALGVSLGICTGALLVFDELPFALLCGFLSVFCDVLDGTIARTFQEETFFGKVFDSIGDRISEIAVVVGALISGIIEPVGMIAIIGSISLLSLRGLSYSRRLNTDYVLFGRAERLVFILFGLLTPIKTISTLLFVGAGFFGIVSSFQIVAFLIHQHTLLTKNAIK